MDLGIATLLLLLLRLAVKFAPAASLRRRRLLRPQLLLGRVLGSLRVIGRRGVILDGAAVFRLSLDVLRVALLFLTSPFLLLPPWV